MCVKLDALFLNFFHFVVEFKQEYDALEGCDKQNISCIALRTLAHILFLLSSKWNLVLSAKFQLPILRISQKGHWNFALIWSYHYCCCCS